MVEVFNDSNNSPGLSLMKEFTFYIVYKHKNARILKSSGKVPKKDGKFHKFFIGSA